MMAQLGSSKQSSKCPHHKTSTNCTCELVSLTVKEAGAEYDNKIQDCFRYVIGILTAKDDFFDAHLEATRAWKSLQTNKNIPPFLNHGHS